jgi:hypothetical protein
MKPPVQTSSTSADKLDKRELHELARRAAVPEEVLKKENGVIVFIISSYSDEVEDANVTKRGVTDKQVIENLRA